MSGIVGSRLNIRGSGLVGSLGTDGQVFTSSGAGVGAVYEAGFDDTDLRSDIITLALKEAITENRVTYNLPNSVIGAISPYPTVVIVTIHQYILVGILLKPDSGPSTKYIIVPNTIHITTTKRRNITIFALLISKALTKKLVSPIYLDIRSTLNILSILRALIAIKVSTWAPTNINARYFGIVASRSIIP